jgi:hypothetical protein
MRNTNLSIRNFPEVRNKFGASTVFRFLEENKSDTILRRHIAHDYDANVRAIGILVDIPTRPIATCKSRNSQGCYQEAHGQMEFANAF